MSSVRVYVRAHASTQSRARLRRDACQLPLALFSSALSQQSHRLGDQYNPPQRKCKSEVPLRLCPSSRALSFG